MNNKKQAFKLAITALLLVILICTPFLVKTISYINAVHFFEEEKYENAITEFERLGKYKDSEEYLSESKYLLASRYMKKEEYFKAIDILEPLVEDPTEEHSVEIKYSLAKCYLNEGIYTSAEELLQQIKSDVDISNEQKEVQYLKAIDLYENGKYDEGMEIFEKLGEDYKDVFNYVKKYQKDRFLGKWVIEDDDLYEKKHDFEMVGIEISSDELALKNKYSNWMPPMSYQVVDGVLIPEDISGNLIPDMCVIKYISNNSIIYESSISQEKLEMKKGEAISVIPPSAPKIGMTEEELLDSAWGVPKDINKTTTAYGVHEQWCYSGYRYVYLDNGIVTGIQE